MDPQHRLEKTSELPVPCQVEVLWAAENEPAATRLYHRHFSHLPPERIRWIERGVDSESSWETAFEIMLTWVEAGMFEPAGYRRPHWTALSCRHCPMPTDAHDNAKRVPTDSVMA